MFDPLDGDVEVAPRLLVRRGVLLPHDFQEPLQIVIHNFDLTSVRTVVALTPR